MTKTSYHFKDSFNNNNQKIKKEMEDVLTDCSDENFDKNDLKIRNHYNEIVEINYYMEQVLKYIIENKISFNDYYKMVANNYCNNIGNLEFEKRNPFVKEKDIIKLKESLDVDNFALELSKIVEDSLIGRMGN